MSKGKSISREVIAMDGRPKDANPPKKVPPCIDIHILALNENESLESVFCGINEIANTQSSIRLDWNKLKIFQVVGIQSLTFLGPVGSFVEIEYFTIRGYEHDLS